MVGRARFELATNWLKARQSQYRHLQNKHLRHLPPVIVSLKTRRNATTQFPFRTFSGTVQKSKNNSATLYLSCVSFINR